VDEVAFGRYRLLSLLGAGGMGKVYKAHDSLMGRDVAIKVLPIELSAETGYRERFRREAQTSARLTEPHIIPIHDTGEIDGQLYLVMPAVDGTDLQALLKRDGPIAPARAVHVIEQLAAALDAAHAAGLVHRDVKPSNVLLTGRDFVYLIDFGIAHDAGAPKLTNTGMVLGSWAYMAPERFTAREAGASADVYSLACVLCECLTGAQPYPGNSLEQQFAGHYSEDPPQPSSVNPAIPAGFDEVIACGMAKDPGQRYPTGYDLAVAARRALTTGPAGNPHTIPAPLDPTQPAPTLDPTQAASESVLGGAAPLAAGPTLFDSSQPPPGPTVAGSTQLAVGPTRLDPSQPPPTPTIVHDVGLRRPSASETARPLGAGLNVNTTNPRAPVRRAPPSPAPPVDQQSARIDAPPTPGQHPPRRWRLFALAAVVLVAASVALAGYLLIPSSESPTPTAQPVAPGGQPVPPTGQSVHPTSVAVPTTQPSAAGTQAQLPFVGLGGSSGVAVDSAGNVYVTDAGNSRVLELVAGSGSPMTMPFAGLSGPSGVAVDRAGDVFVTNTANGGVLKLAAGSTSTTELPIADVTGLRGVAVNSAADVYVCGGADKVLKLAAGSTNTTEPPFTGLNNPGGVAVDGAGNVYVADTGNNRILKLAGGAAAATGLPFTGLNNPGGVAVDGAGNVYVADTGNNRILKTTTG
jgi:serine/threonine-protein kinase